LNVECSYDNNGNLTSITPPDGGTVSYVFDGAMPSSLVSNQSSTMVYVDNNNGKPDVITRTVTKNGLIATVSRPGHGNRGTQTLFLDYCGVSAHLREKTGGSFR